MTVIPAFAEPIAEGSAVALARYAQLIGYWECSFWGVRRDGALNTYYDASVQCHFELQRVG